MRRRRFSEEPIIGGLPEPGRARSYPEAWWRICRSMLLEMLGPGGRSHPVRLAALAA